MHWIPFGILMLTCIADNYRFFRKPKKKPYTCTYTEYDYNHQ